jgi:hypothetical protein
MTTGSRFACRYGRRLRSVNAAIPQSLYRSKILYSVFREMPTAAHSGAIFSPSSRRATNRSRSSMT